MSHPVYLIFEDTSSPLVRSNDGNLMHRTDEGGMVNFVQAEYGPGEQDRGHIVIASYDRLVTDAFIAGYDLAAETVKREAKLLDPVVEDDDVEVEGYKRRSESLHAELLCEDSALD